MFALRKPWMRPAMAINWWTRRTFGASSLHQKKQMPPRPAHPDDSEFTEAFLKGSGPGGQKINKTSSAVQLKHKRTGLVVKVQETRSRSQNRKIARQLLADRIEAIDKGSESRTAILEATKVKRKSSSIKKSKRKYKALEAAKAEAAGADSHTVDENNSPDFKYENAEVPEAGNGKGDV